MAEQQQAQRSTKMKRSAQSCRPRWQKTIVVEVSRRVPHPMYKRIVTQDARSSMRTMKKQTASVGDTVRIIEHRPLSKLKRWTLGDIVRRAVQVGVEPDQVDPAAEASTGAHGKDQKVAFDDTNRD